MRSPLIARRVAAVSVLSLTGILGATSAFAAPTEPDSPESPEPTQSPAPEPGPTTIDVLSFNDFHGRIVSSEDARGGPDDAGAAVLSCAIDTYRAANPNTMVLSAGDNIGESPYISARSNDLHTIRALNTIGVNASALGNDDLGYSADAEEPNFPYLAANVFREDGSYAYEPYTIIESGGVSVGVIGVTTELLSSMVGADQSAGLTVGDMTEAVNAVAADLTDGDESNGEADVLIVLAHDGAPGTELSSAAGTPFGELANGVDENVSAVISGHTQQAYVEQAGDLWVTQAGEFGQNLGRLQIVVSEDGAASVTLAENVDLVTEAGPICAGDPEVQGIVDNAIDNAYRYSPPVGKIAADLSRGLQSDGETQNQGAESTMGNFVADAQLWATQRSETQIAFVNANSLLSDVRYIERPWDDVNSVVDEEYLSRVQPLPERLIAMDLTGSQIFALLEQQWQPDGTFLKLGVSEGFAYTYDPNAPAGERILQATLNGESIDAGTAYRVSANVSLAAGGDNFTTFADGTNRADTGEGTLSAIRNYLSESSDSDTPYTPSTVQRGVGISWTGDPNARATGDRVEFDLSSLAFTDQEAKPTEVTVTLDGTEVGTYPVDVTAVDGTDETGRASVSFEVPEGMTGDVEMQVSDDVNGVIYAQTLTIDDDDDDDGNWLLDLLKQLFPWLPWL